MELTTRNQLLVHAFRQRQRETKRAFIRSSLYFVEPTINYSRDLQLNQHPYHNFEFSFLSKEFEDFEELRKNYILKHTEALRNRLYSIEFRQLSAYDHLALVMDLIYLVDKHYWSLPCLFFRRDGCSSTAALVAMDPSCCTSEELLYWTAFMNEEELNLLFLDISYNSASKWLYYTALFTFLLNNALHIPSAAEALIYLLLSDISLPQLYAIASLVPLAFNALFCLNHYSEILCLLLVKHNNHALRTLFYYIILKGNWIVSLNTVKSLHSAILARKYSLPSQTLTNYTFLKIASSVLHDLYFSGQVENKKLFLIELRNWANANRKYLRRYTNYCYCLSLIYNYFTQWYLSIYMDT